MKKIVLSSVLALTLGTVSATAGDMKFYTDENGQVFVTPGQGRTELKANPSEVMEAMEAATQVSAKDMKEEIKSELKDEMKKDTPVFAKSSKLKFSGLTYLGYTSYDYDKNLASGALNTKKDSGQFEIRRSYFQLKAYLLEDPKSYFRVTLDLTKDALNDEKVRAKYAYLYLNDVLPATGVEIGLAHRPWHDYEEHNSWYYRNISKVLIEDKVFGPDLSNSADYGVMFKTKTKYFDSDIGLFNGEGYHGAQATENSGEKNSMSLEWRTTAHLMGVNGKDKQTKKTYADASFFGQYNKDHKNVTVGAVTEDQDLIFMGLHAVYNQPSFLVAGQYVTSKNTSDIAGNASGQAGSGYSLNGEYRFGNDYQYRALARYDTWTPKEDAGVAEKDNSGYILGAAWEQNKNLQWVANVIVADSDASALRETNNGTQYMLTAEIRY